MSPTIPSGASELRQSREHLRRQHSKHLAVAERIARAIASLDEAIALVEDVPVSTARPTEPSLGGIEPTSVPESPGAPSGTMYSPLRLTGWADRLQGMTQMEALIAIAEHNGGQVKATEARDILVRAGLAKGQLKNVATTVHHLLGSSDEFEKLRPGIYRLKSMRRSRGSASSKDAESAASNVSKEDVVVLRSVTTMGRTPVPDSPSETGRPTLVWEEDHEQDDTPGIHPSWAAFSTASRSPR